MAVVIVGLRCVAHRRKPPDKMRKQPYLNGRRDEVTPAVLSASTETSQVDVSSASSSSFNH